MSAMLRRFAKKMHFMNTARALRWDLTRASARRRTGRMLRAMEAAGGLPHKLHLGSGSKKIPGWLNCDVIDTDVDVDLGCGTLPFPDAHFDMVTAQHFIEHLSLEEELQPLLADTHRCMRTGGEIWLSCPDIEKVCRSYIEDGGESLVRDRQSRWPSYNTNGYPASYVVNDLFVQRGQHKNLFDLTLIGDVLTKAGFSDVTRRDETQWLEKFPEFPPRRDDFQSIYVSARK